MELAALQEYAETRGFEDSIKDFDVEFFKRKQIRSIYGVEEEAQRDFFPLPHVLKGVFRKGSRTRKNINPPFLKFIHNFLTFLPLKGKKKSENKSDVSQKTCFHQDNCVIYIFCCGFSLMEEHYNLVFTLEKTKGNQKPWADEVSVYKVS